MRHCTRNALLLLAVLAATSCTTTAGVLESKQHEAPGAFVDVGRVRTYYVHAGQGTRNLVLIHGLAGSTFSFRHNIAPLAEHFSVYALDMRGFGASDKPLKGYALKDLSAHVAGFMNVMDINDSVLIGNSMGGEVALYLALQHPERVDGLVLIDSAGFLRLTDTPIRNRTALVAPGVGDVLTAPFMLRNLANRQLVARYLRRVYHDPAVITPEVVDGFYLPLSRPAGRRGLLGRLRAQDWGGIADKIHDVAAPTLVLWGMEDQLIPVEHAARFQKALPHARVIRYPNCGHHPQAERADRVNHDIIQFVSTLS